MKHKSTLSWGIQAEKDFIMQLGSLQVQPVFHPPLWWLTKYVEVSHLRPQENWVKEAREYALGLIRRIKDGEKDAMDRDWERRKAELTPKSRITRGTKRKAAGEIPKSFGIVLDNRP